MGLLEVIASSPREVTPSVPQLLRETCRAIAGRPLFEDDRSLRNAIERLLQVRSKVAHGG